MFHRNLILGGLAFLQITRSIPKIWLENIFPTRRGNGGFEPALPFFTAPAPRRTPPRRAGILSAEARRCDGGGGREAASLFLFDLFVYVFWLHFYHLPPSRKSTNSRARVRWVEACVVFAIPASGDPFRWSRSRKSSRFQYRSLFASADPLCKGRACPRGCLIFGAFTAELCKLS